MTKKPETIKEEDLIEKYGVMYKKYLHKQFSFLFYPFFIFINYRFFAG